MSAQTTTKAPIQDNVKSPTNIIMYTTTLGLFLQ